MPSILTSVSERLMNARHVVGVYLGTVVCCRYAVPTHLQKKESEGDLQAVVEQAIAINVLEHPLLQAGMLKPTTTKPTWCRLPTIDLQKHITWASTSLSAHEYDDFIRSTARTEVDSPFLETESRPGWRIIVMRNGDDSPSIDILFNWNHPHCDGTSGKIFHETLLRFFNKHFSAPINDDSLVPQLDNHILTTTAGFDGKPFTPSFEKLAPASVSFPFVTKVLAKELPPAWMVPNDPTASTWAPARLPSKATCETVVQGFFVGQQALSSLLEQCRTRKASLTALLHGIIFVSLLPVLEKHNIRPGAIAGETAINLRRFVGDPGRVTKKNPSGLDLDETMVCCVSIFQNRFNKDIVQEVMAAFKEAAQHGDDKAKRMAFLEKMVWTATASAKRDIDKRLSQGMKNETMGLLRYAGDLNSYAESLKDKPRHNAWLVTNIGVIDGGNLVAQAGDGQPTSSAWAIQKCQFVLSADVTGGVYQMATMTVKGGDLSVNVCSPRGVVDESIGHSLVEEVEKWLKFLSGRRQA